MNRRLVASRFPYIPLRLRIPEQPSDIELVALVDTGFDGDLIIPATALAGAEAGENQLTWRLADGSYVIAATYAGTVELIGLQGSYSVVVSVLGDETLAGRSLTDRFTLTLAHGRELTVEL